MSTLTQFLGSTGPISSIVNYYSSGGVNSAVAIVASSVNGCKEITPPTLTLAATLYTALTVTGRGCVNIISAYTGNTTSRTVRLQVIVDGVTIFDATTDAITTSGHGLVAVGQVGDAGGTGVSQVFQPVLFNASLVVKVASSVPTDATNIKVGANYEVWA